MKFFAFNLIHTPKQEPFVIYNKTVAKTSIILNPEGVLPLNSKKTGSCKQVLKIQSSIYF